MLSWWHINYYYFVETRMLWGKKTHVFFHMCSSRKVSRQIIWCRSFTHPQFKHIRKYARSFARFPSTLETENTNNNNIKFKFGREIEKQNGAKKRSKFKILLNMIFMLTHRYRLEFQMRQLNCDILTRSFQRSARLFFSRRFFISKLFVFCVDS